VTARASSAAASRASAPTASPCSSCTPRTSAELWWSSSRP